MGRGFEAREYGPTQMRMVDPALVPKRPVEGPGCRRRRLHPREIPARETLGKFKTKPLKL